LALARIAGNATYPVLAVMIIELYGNFLAVFIGPPRTISGTLGVRV